MKTTSLFQILYEIVLDASKLIFPSATSGNEFVARQIMGWGVNSLTDETIEWTVSVLCHAVYHDALLCSDIKPMSKL